MQNKPKECKNKNCGQDVICPRCGKWFDWEFDTTKPKENHCTGCNGDSWDLPEGRTHQMGTIEHPEPKENWEEKFEKMFSIKNMLDTNLTFVIENKSFFEGMIEIRNIKTKNFIKSLLSQQKTEWWIKANKECGEAVKREKQALIDEIKMFILEDNDDDMFKKTKKLDNCRVDVYISKYRVISYLQTLEEKV